MKELSFFVPGVPVAKTYGFSKGGKQYMKANVKRWENTVRLAAQAAVGAAFKPHEGFVRLEMEFSFPIPPSRRCAYEHELCDCKKKLHTLTLHGQDPDVSNLVKSTEDALKRLVFLDDNTVVLGMCFKTWCNPGNEGVQITVRFL